MPTAAVPLVVQRIEASAAVVASETWTDCCARLLVLLVTPEPTRWVERDGKRILDASARPIGHEPDDLDVMRAHRVLTRHVELGLTAADAGLVRAAVMARVTTGGGDDRKRIEAIGILDWARLAPSEVERGEPTPSALPDLKIQIGGVCSRLGIGPKVGVAVLRICAEERSQERRALTANGILKALRVSDLPKSAMPRTNRKLLNLLHELAKLNLFVRPKQRSRDGWRLDTLGVSLEEYLLDPDDRADHSLTSRESA